MNNKNERSDKILKVLETIIRKEQGKNDEFITLPIPLLFTKKLTSLMLIRLDLLFVIDCIHELLIIKRKDEAARNKTIQTSLWYSILATYAKCFTSNKGGRSKLDEKDIFESKDEKLKGIHDGMMELRHSYIAHRDETENEQAVIFMKINKGVPHSELIEYNISAIKVISPSESSIVEYERLLNHLLDIVQSKIQKEIEKVQDGFLNFLDTDTENLYLKHIAF